MSIETFVNVWERSQREGTDLLLLLALADTGGSGDDPYLVSFLPRHVAEKARITTREVLSRIEAMVEAGELSFEYIPALDEDGIRFHLPGKGGAK